MRIEYVIRDAQRRDIPQLARLFNELGHPVDEDSISSSWDEWENAGNAAIVAEQADGSIQGDITLHHMRVLHRPYLVGRITSLIVTASVRGQGIGRALVNVPQQIAVVILTNTGCYQMPHIGRRILQECMGERVEPFRFPKQREIERSVLREFVGTYQFNADEQIVLSLGPSHLEVRFTGEPKYPLFAKSTNEFFCTVDEVEIVFNCSDSGTTTSLTVDHFGDKTVAPRVTIE